MFGFKKFVACFHVGKVQVGEHIRQGGQNFIPDGVPEKENAVGFSSGKPGTENNIGKTVGNGF